VCMCVSVVCVVWVGVNEVNEGKYFFRNCIIIVTL